MTDVLRAIAIFVWTWTHERGRELVVAAPKYNPGLLLLVTIVGCLVAAMYVLIRLGAL